MDNKEYYKNECINQKNDYRGLILDYLNTHGETQIASLAKKFNIRVKALKLIVKSLIEGGIPVLSKKGSYYICNDKNDLIYSIDKQIELEEKLLSKKEILIKNFNSFKIDKFATSNKVKTLLNMLIKNNTAMTMKDINDNMPEEYFIDKTDIIDMINKGIPIGSSDKPNFSGYFLIRNRDDLLLATLSIDKRLNGVLNRKENLMIILKNKFNK